MCGRNGRVTLYTMSRALDRFIAAGPWPERTGMGLLVALARRPRGRRLLARLAPVEQLAGGLLAMEHYEGPAVARRLGWDADAVVSRGRALRREEGRP
jgi:hypothetical protein